MKLIYISNTRIPSEKANTYQSMVMCEAFSKQFKNVEFWYPNRKNTVEMEKIDDPFEFYGIKKTFILKKLFAIDFHSIALTFPKVWFLLLNITFCFSYILKLIGADSKSIVFTRDTVGLKIISLVKKIGILKQKVYFESHAYSKNVSSAIKYIDGLVVINNYLRELYEKDGINNILVAHDGVNIDEYSSISYKEKQNLFHIVYTGNLFEWKGVYTLADSLKYLENVKCTIVGGSNDTLPQFRKYIEDNNIKNVELTGFVRKSETIQYIEQADVLILPNSAKDKMSYYTSPLKLFEYMASKRPIVASKLPSIEEILTDKKNAILCKPDDPKDLANKIKWVLENDCTEIANDAYQDVQEYTWDKRAQNIVKWMRTNVF